jgi:hypothetical protein
MFEKDKKSDLQANSHTNTRLFLGSSRSQVAIFVIIAILLVIAVGIVFIVRSSMEREGETLTVGADNVGDFVTNCLALTSENGLIFIGRQGGYYRFASEPNIAYSGNDSEPGILFTELGDINIPYYFYNSQNTMVSKEKIEEQLSLYVKDNLNNCIKDFDIFEQKGFSINAGNINATTKILDDKVEIFLDYPVTITKADFTQTKTAYSVDFPIRLKEIYNITQTFLSLQTINSGRLCVECLIAAVPASFHIQVLISDDNTNLFILTDKERKLNNSNYDFIFAYKY